MKNLILFIALMGVFVMAHSQQPLSPSPPSDQISNAATAAQFSGSGTHSNLHLTYRIIDAPNSTYCYDVYADGRLMIHQTSTPGMPGNEGFKTKEDATKVALLAIDKIKKGEMPPTISVDEMKKLSVIK